MTPPGVARAGAAGGSFFGGGDDCTAPDVVVGTGTFSFDNTAATTGIDGQTEILCDAFGTTGIDNDVWFEWTATADGLAVMQTCGTAFDTKIAAYPDFGGCPPGGSAIACNDDTCGLQSQINFPVTTGTSYLIQAGNFPGSAAGPSALTISIAGAAGNDDCSSPDPLSGQGNFPYNNGGATTGAEGQNETLCDAFGTTGIDNDIWYEWTADGDGIAVIDTCLDAQDTKLAAYPSGGCPADGSAIACNDDTCGLQSEISFACTTGTTYLLQVGNFPGSSGGSGTLNIRIDTPPEPPTCYDGDDGTSELSIGLTAGGEVVWMSGFDSIGGSDVITSIGTAYGTPTFPGLTPGLPGRFAIWDDPTNDFDPSDAVLLWSASTTGMNEDTDIINSMMVPSIAVSGVFFIGASLDNIVGEFPAPLDQSAAGGSRSWIMGSTLGPGTADLANVLANDVPPLNNAAIGFDGLWLLRAEGDNCADSGLGTNYCTGASNSVSVDGSTISATGSASIGDANLTLSADNAPGQPAIFYFGPNQIDLAFGNGRRCVGGTVFRMDIIVGSGGTFDYMVDFGAYGADIAGLGTCNFQCWYRDPAAGGAAFNLSDAVEITFTP